MQYQEESGDQHSYRVRSSTEVRAENEHCSLVISSGRWATYLPCSSALFTLNFLSDRLYLSSLELFYVWLVKLKAHLTLALRYRARLASGSRWDALGRQRRRRRGATHRQCAADAAHARYGSAHNGGLAPGRVVAENLSKKCLSSSKVTAAKQ